MEILSKARLCRQCSRRGIAAPKEPPKEKPKLRPEAFLICEAERPDGFFHVARKANKKTICLKIYKELPIRFRQGAEALRLLSRDEGCCTRCREFLQNGVFGDNN